MAADTLTFCKLRIKERLFLACQHLILLRDSEFPERDREEFRDLIKELTSRPRPHPLNRSPKAPFRDLLVKLHYLGNPETSRDDLVATIDAISEDTAITYAKRIFQLYLKAEVEHQIRNNL